MALAQLATSELAEVFTFLSGAYFRLFKELAGTGRAGLDAAGAVNPIRCGPTADGRPSGDVAVRKRGSGEDPRPAARTQVPCARGLNPDLAAIR